MVAPIVELLRAVAGLREGDLTVSKRVILLASSHTGPGGSAVESEWTASLHPTTSS
jgi:hypothetical protein